MRHGLWNHKSLSNNGTTKTTKTTKNELPRPQMSQRIVACFVIFVIFVVHIFVVHPLRSDHPATVVVVGADSENSPVLSPKVFTLSSPRLCISVNITFAIGVPSSAFRWRFPFRWPFAWPRRISGQRRWLW